MIFLMLIDVNINYNKHFSGSDHFKHVIVYGAVTVIPYTPGTSLVQMKCPKQNNQNAFLMSHIR